MEQLTDSSEGQWVDRARTECQHEYVVAESDPLSNMQSVACCKCWHGASIDPRLYEIKDGKISSKERTDNE